MPLPVPIADWLLSDRARPVWRALLAVLLALVGWLALDPAPPPAVDTGWDKLNHALAFATLAAVAVQALRPRPRREAEALAALLAYGALIELLQSRIPGRSGEWPDLLADAAGIAAGLLAARVAERLIGARVR